MSLSFLLICRTKPLQLRVQEVVLLQRLQVAVSNEPQVDAPANAARNLFVGNFEHEWSNNSLARKGFQVVLLPADLLDGRLLLGWRKSVLQSRHWKRNNFFCADGNTLF